jgi:hypothetical protein
MSNPDPLRDGFVTGRKSSKPPKPGTKVPATVNVGTTEDFERLGTATPSTADADILSVRAQADLVVVAHRKVQFYEDKLKAAKAELLTLETERLPDAMTAAGMDSFQLSDGTKITCEPYLTYSISEERRPAAMECLKTLGYSHLIKTNLEVSLPKGEVKLADQAKAALAKLGITVTQKETVHPSTMKAFLNELLRDGKLNLPVDLFGLWSGKRAKVTFPK